MEEALLDIIKLIENEKRDERREPHFALRMEVYARVNDALNNLYKQGRIKVGDTINDKWISSEVNGNKE